MTKRPSAGNPSPWVSLPATPIRLPQKYHEDLRIVARLLDSGAIDSTDILSLSQPKQSNKPPTLAEIQAAIEGITQGIVTAKGWDLTAVELGCITHSLEQSAKAIDAIFAEKAKAAAMAIATERKALADAAKTTKRTRKPSR